MVCHLIQDLKVPSSNHDKDSKFIELGTMLDFLDSEYTPYCLSGYGCPSVCVCLSVYLSMSVSLFSHGPKVSPLTLHFPCPNSTIPFVVKTVFLYIWWSKGSCSTGFEPCCNKVFLTLVMKKKLFQFLLRMINRTRNFFLLIKYGFLQSIFILFILM